MLMLFKEIKEVTINGYTVVHKDGHHGVPFGWPFDEDSVQTYGDHLRMAMKERWSLSNDPQPDDHTMKGTPNGCTYHKNKHAKFEPSNIFKNDIELTRNEDGGYDIVACRCKLERGVIGGWHLDTGKSAYIICNSCDKPRLGLNTYTYKTKPLEAHLL